MVRPSVVAATAGAQRARLNSSNSTHNGTVRPQVPNLASTHSIFNGVQGYGTISSAGPSYGMSQSSSSLSPSRSPPHLVVDQHHQERTSNGHDDNVEANVNANENASAITISPNNATGSTSSYHGQLHRASSPALPSEEEEEDNDDDLDAVSSQGSDNDSISTTTMDSEEGRSRGRGSRRRKSKINKLAVLPSYSDFKLTHYLLDLPLTLLILALFLLLAVFGWPVPDSPYPHHLHWKQLGLGAIVWISTEAIRRRLFRFLSSSRYPLIRSTPFLLFLSTFIQELLRLFAIRLTFHHEHSSNIGDPPPLPPPSSSILVALRPSGLLGPPPRPPKGFFKAFHLALGFASSENIWQTLILLGQVRLYEDVLSPVAARAWLVGEENVLSVGGAPPSDASVAPSDVKKKSNTDLQHLDGFSDTSEPSVAISHDGGHPSDPQHHRQQQQEGTDNVAQEPISFLDDSEFVTDAPIVSEAEFEAYIRDRKRIEYEDSFGGIPLWDISVFVIAMWRLDATLLHLSLTLLLSLPFHHNWTDIPPRRHPALPIHLPLWPTFCAVVLLHWLLSLGWSLGIRDRQRFSLAGISYVTLVGVLGTFFAGLGVWSALI